MEIVARARRLNWPVEQGTAGNGYKIIRPDGKTVQVHLTPSDVNHYKSVLRRLNECDFEAAERELLERKLVEREEENRRLVKEAEERARLMARNNKALVGAAGSYMVEPEAPDPDWVLSKEHPAPWVRYMTITPELADLLLTERNTHNRPIYKANVRAFKEIMAEKKWRFTHQGVALDQTGTLQDGQHRLAGIVESDEPQALLVFVGMDPENFTDIDTGKDRSGADTLGIVTKGDLGRKNSMVRLVNLYTNVGANVRTKLSNREIFEGWTGDADRLQYALNWGVRIGRKTKVNYSAAAAAAYLLFKLHGDEHPMVEQFLLGLEYRPDERSGDPRVLLHRYVQEAFEKSKRVPNYGQLALIIDTWNMCADGVVVTKRTHLRWSKDRKLPRIAQIGATSAAPTFLAPAA